MSGEHFYSSTMTISNYLSLTANDAKFFKIRTVKDFCSLTEYITESNNTILTNFKTEHRHLQKHNIILMRQPKKKKVL